MGRRACTAPSGFLSLEPLRNHGPWNRSMYAALLPACLLTSRSPPPLSGDLQLSCRLTILFKETIRELKEMLGQPTRLPGAVFAHLRRVEAEPFHQPVIRCLEHRLLLCGRIVLERGVGGTM